MRTVCCNGKVDLHAKLVALQVQDRTEERKRLNDCLHAGVAQAQWGVGVRDTARARCAAPRARARLGAAPACASARRRTRRSGRQRLLPALVPEPTPIFLLRHPMGSLDGILTSHAACAQLCTTQTAHHVRRFISKSAMPVPSRVVGLGCCPRRLFDGVLPEPSSHEHVYVPLGWQRSRRAYQARSAAAR